MPVLNGCQSWSSSYPSRVVATPSSSVKCSRIIIIAHQSVTFLLILIRTSIWISGETTKSFVQILHPDFRYTRGEHEEEELGILVVGFEYIRHTHHYHHHCHHHHLSNVRTQVNNCKKLGRGWDKLMLSGAVLTQTDSRLDKEARMEEKKVLVKRKLS